MYEKAELTLYPNPVLRQNCAPVKTFDESVRQLAKRMFEVMYEHKGVGLAAPQIGVSLRVYVVNTTGEPAGEHVLINPEVLETSGSQTDGEGCLSFPGVNIKVVRPNFARMKAQDVEGNWREFEGRDLLARCYLHELDHLNGVLLIDKMSMLQKMNWRRALRQLEEDWKNRKTPAK